MPQKTLKAILEESSTSNGGLAIIEMPPTAHLPMIKFDSEVLYQCRAISPTNSVMTTWEVCKEDQSNIQKFFSDAYVNYVLNNDDEQENENFNKQKSSRATYKRLANGHSRTIMSFWRKDDQITTKEDRHQEFIKFLEHNKKYLDDIKFNWKNFYTYINEQLNQHRSKKNAQHVYEMFCSQSRRSSISTTEQDQRDLTSIYTKIHQPLVYPQFADEIIRLMSDQDGNFNKERTQYYLDKIYNDGWIEKRKMALIVNVFVACSMTKFKVGDDNDLWSKYKKIQAVFKEDKYTGVSIGLESLSNYEPFIRNKLAVKKIILGLVMMLAMAGLVAAGGVGVASIFFEKNEDLEALIYILGAVVGAFYGGRDISKRMQTTTDSTLRMLARDFLGKEANTISHFSFDHQTESLKFIGIGFGMAASILYYIDISIEIFAQNSKEGLFDLDASLYIFLIVATSVLGALAAYFNYKFEIAAADDLAVKNQQDWLGQTISPPEDMDSVQLDNKLEFQSFDTGMFLAKQQTASLLNTCK